MPATLADPVAAFWSRMERDENDCWNWTGSKTNGYGEMRIKNVNHRAHRLAWELTHGPIPDGLVICHHCDNPACCNPAHLFVGSHADNVADKVRKGRGRCGALRGEDAPWAKLTADQVRAIRAEYEAGGVTQVALGKRYGVDHTLISLIVRRKKWSHL